MRRKSAACRTRSRRSCSDASARRSPNSQCSAVIDCPSLGIRIVAWPVTFVKRRPARRREGVAADRPRDRVRRGRRRGDGDRTPPSGPSADPPGRRGFSPGTRARRVHPAARARRRLLRFPAAHPLGGSVLHLPSRLQSLPSAHRAPGNRTRARDVDRRCGRSAGAIPPG